MSPPLSLFLPKEGKLMAECNASLEAVTEQDPTGFDGCPLCGRPAEEHEPELSRV